jgi:hypothetical protein
MDFEPDDPLLDSLLDEVLAGRTPPDLTARILQAYAARQYGEDAPEPPPVLTGVQKVFEPAAAKPTVQAPAKYNSRQRRSQSRTSALTIVLAAAVIGFGITIGLVALLRSNQPQIARDDKKPQPTIAPAPRTFATRPQQPQPEINRIPGPETTTTIGPRIVQQTPVRQTPVEPAPTPLPEPKVAPPQPAAQSAIATTPIPRKQRDLNPSPDAQIVSFVNAELARVWKDAGVKPTPAATDAEWCQRLFVRLLGRAPTADEQKALATDNARNRREKLVERLLTQSDFVTEFANHWSAVLTNVFLGRSGGRSGPASRDELEKYFASALKGGKSYDHLAEELLTATGSPREGSEAYNPAVNFLLDGLDPTAAIPTTRVARVMLGHQLQCAQCHNHPTQDWTQEQFWALDACFRGLRIDRQDGGARLAATGTSGFESNITYETPDGLMKSVSPRFLDGTQIPAGEGVDPRRDLARLVVDSDDFAKATVNRIWAQLFDYGFTRPVDDLGPHASPTAPAVLDRLATEFAAHDFDLKQLIRWAVLSEPFSHSSKLADLVSKDMPEEGEPALFSRFYARAVQAPPALGALVQAARIRANASSRSEVESARIAWLANQTPQPKGGKKAAPMAGSSVLMPGSDPQHRSVSGDPTGLVKRIAGSNMPPARQVEHLFLAALARQPRPPEQQAALQLLSNAQGNTAAALEDIWWALQNSSECVLDR